MQKTMFKLLSKIKRTLEQVLQRTRQDYSQDDLFKVYYPKIARHLKLSKAMSLSPDIFRLGVDIII